jgi:hypothetical protein
VSAATGDHAIARQAFVSGREEPSGVVAFTARFGEATWGYAPSDRVLAPALLDGAAVIADRTGTVVALGGAET